MMTLKKLRGTVSLFVACVLVLGALAGCVQKAPEPEPEKEEETNKRTMGFRIGYAEEGVTAVDDPDALQKAVDAAYAQAAEEGIALEYKNVAYSSDGTTFECYIANAEQNKYDMFIAIFADPELSDELFLSQLLRPGTAFSSVALSHPLDEGTHEVYIVHTQVEEVDGEQAIRGQMTVTADFVVQPE